MAPAVKSKSKTLWLDPNLVVELDSEFALPLPRRSLWSRLPVQIQQRPRLVASSVLMVTVALIAILTTTNEKTGRGDSPLTQNSPTTTGPTIPSSSSPSAAPVKITFNPGELIVSENGLLLSEGLTARVIAQVGEKVQYETDGSLESSEIPFHGRPDFGATFVDERPGNEGGWIYVSNSEMKDKPHGQGGVGAFTFDANGHVMDYRMVLNGTHANCGGGTTPWGAWISCEEYGRGNCWQVDPTGARPGQRITLGLEGGSFESFAYDVRNPEMPRFYISEDKEDGAMQRLTPDHPDWSSPWSMLLGNGTIDYLELLPTEYGDDDDGYPTGGNFIFTPDLDSAKRSAELCYSHSEGIDVANNELFLVSKEFKSLFVLNLDDGTYRNQTTRSGMFNGQPDQLQRILGPAHDDFLFFTEEGGRDAGIHCRNEAGLFFKLLEILDHKDETTGLAFSPNGQHLYVAYQEAGLLFAVQRTDGLPFHATTLNVKYHATGAD